MNKQLKLAAIALVAFTVPILSASAGEKPFPKIVPVLDGSYHEGFAIGKGSTGYSGSPDGSVYKVNLRSGQGEVLVPPVVPFDVINDCWTLGMRVDPRSNYLFVAGCFHGNTLVYNADTGNPIANYQLDDSGLSLINDLAITKDSVYFTDFWQPFIYRLPLSKNGQLPKSAGAAIAIPLIGDFEEGDNLIGVFANGIVATPDGKTLIIGHSGSSKIFKVDPTTGYADEIIVDPPLLGLLEGSFLDGIVLHDGVLYILSPGETAEGDLVQVVVLGEDLLTGSFVGTISDSYMDGIASGAMHGDSLYVNAARYADFPEPDTKYWITKLNIYDVDPVE